MRGIVFRTSLSSILEGVHSKEIGLYEAGSVGGLFGFRMGMILAVFLGRALVLGASAKVPRLLLFWAGSEKILGGRRGRSLSAAIGPWHVYQSPLGDVSCAFSPSNSLIPSLFPPIVPSTFLLPPFLLLPAGLGGGFGLRGAHSR